MSHAALTPALVNEKRLHARICANRRLLMSVPITYTRGAAQTKLFTCNNSIS